MTTRMVTWGTYAQKFDVENRLETVTVNGKTTRFFYDADGNRVLAVYKTNAVETSRTYTPFPDYEEEQPAGDTATRRVTFSANGQAVVQRRQKGDTVDRFSLHTDHLGNVAAVANSAGVYVTNSYAVYEPFGAFNVQPTATNPSVSDRGFTGHRQNNTGAYDLKLIYMNARYYHPQLGRFVSPDTIVPEPGEPQSYNRYAYSYNNPINYIDPTGHLTEDEVLEYFGFSSREEMIKAGWEEFLVNWLFNSDVLWGEVFTYNDGEGEAMLVLFEAKARDSGHYTGGFYRLNGEKYGTQLSLSLIHI